MHEAMSEIRKSLTLILTKLETIDSKLIRQEEEIKAYMEKSPASLDSNELIIAGLKSTKTSFELLRDEIDDLYQLTVALCKRQ
jgi:hypothetical protein